MRARWSLAHVALAVVSIGCRKQPAERKGERVDLVDQGTVCVRAVGGVFQGPGHVEVEATSTVKGKHRCTGFDMTSCTLEAAESGELVVRSSTTLFPPYGQCAGDAAALEATCRTVIRDGAHDVVFGSRRARGRFVAWDARTSERGVPFDLESTKVCIDE